MEADDELARIDADIDQIRAALDDPDTLTDSERARLVAHLSGGTEGVAEPPVPIPSGGRFWIWDGRAHLIARVFAIWSASCRRHDLTFVHDSGCPGCLPHLTERT